MLQRQLCIIWMCCVFGCNGGNLMSVLDLEPLTYEVMANDCEHQLEMTFPAYLFNKVIDLALDSSCKPLAESYNPMYDGSTTFFLFRKHSKYSPEVFKLRGLKNLKTFDSRKPVKIFIHGWNTGILSTALANYTVEGFLHHSDFNVIGMDWSQFACRHYSSSRYKVTGVGKHLAKLITRLHSLYNIKPESLHIVGHSLGSHIAGIAGKMLTHGKIGRITGLDPGGWLFCRGGSHRLTQESAVFVDVIHTSGGLAGTFEKLGHVDFYPSGGYSPQPACDAMSIHSERGIFVLLDWVACSHEISYKYLSSALIYPGGMKAYKCSSWEDYLYGDCIGTSNTISVGAIPSPSFHGSYYFVAEKEWPYFKLEDYLSPSGGVCPKTSLVLTVVLSVLIHSSICHVTGLS